MKTIIEILLSIIKNRYFGCPNIVIARILKSILESNIDCPIRLPRTNEVRIAITSSDKIIFIPIPSF